MLFSSYMKGVKSMADLTGRRFGKLVVVGPSYKKGGYRMFTMCKCDCGRSREFRESNLISGNSTSCGCHRIIDLVGKRYGQLTVLALDHTDDLGSHWLCQCDCGNQKVVRANSLRSGDTKTCGQHRLDLVGKRFGKLIVVGRDLSTTTKTKRVRWACQCDCGNTTSVSSDNLKSGNTTSCGCAKFTAKLIHGMTGTPTYKAWDGMIQRCTNINDAGYADYGGRGITVCDRWLVFSNFLEDMGVKPDGHELERMDNNRGYYSENCKWATRKEQNKNKRNNRLLTMGEDTLCLCDWAEKTGINGSTIIERLKRGWSVERALTTPPKQGLFVRKS